MLRKLLRCYRYWRRGLALRTDWWADRLELVWVCQAVPLYTIDTYCVKTGATKRGFVLRRHGAYLNNPVHHDLRYYRRWAKQYDKNSCAPAKNREIPA